VIEAGANLHLSPKALSVSLLSSIAQIRVELKALDRHELASAALPGAEHLAASTSPEEVLEHVFLLQRRNRSTALSAWHDAPTVPVQAVSGGAGAGSFLASIDGYVAPVLSAWGDVVEREYDRRALRWPGDPPVEIERIMPTPRR